VSLPVPEDIFPLLRRFAEPFANTSPAIVSRFQKETPEPLFPFGIATDRGLGILLLCAALYRPGAESRGTRVITGLYAALGNDVFKLNRIPFGTLQTALSNLPLAPDPEEQKRIPGILRSVCDFFYERGSLRNWLAAAETWEKCVQQMSEAIYWMGRHSPWRTKSRYFLWLASFQDGFAAQFPQSENFSWPVGEGHGRFYGHILRPAMYPAARFKAKETPETSPEARLRFFRDLGRSAFPGESWKLFQVLDAYLRPEKEHEYLCRKIQGGCKPCPFVKRCPAAMHLGESRR